MRFFFILLVTLLLFLGPVAGETIEWILSIIILLLAAIFFVLNDIYHELKKK